MTEWSRITHVPDRHAFVRDHFARVWHDGPALSVEIEAFRPAYEVEGRRRNGSVKGRQPVRWFFGRILLPLRDIVLAPIAILGNGPSSSYRTSKVSGPANGMGVAFADATKAEHQKYEVDPCWFVWTRNRSALIRIARDEFRVTILWQGDGPARPHVDPPNRTLRWRDGSTVELRLRDWEAQQAATLPPG
ncbi:hypothetical protein KIPE111705_44930 [Kibdelosporangium persicum]|uniref:Uncharacterized protein n=1 Tax=Kibdelosporangium persicum TaxID=2698649 RepID=A0ABX2FAI6_9PSEU|nr:hypothetical protein [Kibdelosporangium persicum]NRN68396.1 hypothetical protein [Kibdelosporangium persicum]